MAVLCHKERTQLGLHKIDSWSWISNTFDFNSAFLPIPPMVVYLLLPKLFMLEYSMYKALDISSVVPAIVFVDLIYSCGFKHPLKTRK